MEKIFLSSEKAYVTLNFGIIFYELTLSTLKIRPIKIPFQINRIYPFGNVLILANLSLLAIYEILSDNIILFRSLNPNNEV